MVHTVIKALESEKAVIFGSYLEMRNIRSFHLWKSRSYTKTNSAQGSKKRERNVECWLTKQWAFVRDLQPCLLSPAAASDLHRRKKNRLRPFPFHLESQQLIDDRRKGIREIILLFFTHLSLIYSSGPQSFLHHQPVYDLTIFSRTGLVADKYNKKEDLFITHGKRPRETELMIKQTKKK